MVKCDMLTSTAVSEEQKQQLRITEESKLHIMFILISLFITYFAVSIDEKRLLCIMCNEDCSCLPDTCPLRKVSSVITLWVLIFFYTLSANTVSSPTSNCKTRYLNDLNHIAALLTLIAGIIRLHTTFISCCKP